MVLPTTLQVTLGLESPVLRWAREKVEDVERRHRHPAEILQRADITTWLDRWVHAGPQPGKADTWQVFFEDQGRWSLAVIGRDRGGSDNFVMSFRPTQGRLLENRIRQGSYSRRQDMNGYDEE